LERFGLTIEWQRVCIVGVGLLGGSIGQALKARRLAKTVAGVCRDAAKAASAQKLGAIDSAYSSIEQASDQADLVFVCTPVQSIVANLVQANRHSASHALLTDVGSTKHTIVEKADQAGLVNFVASHPMAGGEKTGVEFSSPDLFVGKLVILTPSESTSQTKLEQTRRLWQSLGATVCDMTAMEHDRAVAATSHLPHLVAAALAGQTPMEFGPLTASGWADSTRIASGNPEMWRQIIQENRGPVLHALKNFATIWQQWIDAIENGDQEQLLQLLQAGKNIRDALGNRHSSG
jgi:prephenate dehydrogenase